MAIKERIEVLQSLDKEYIDNNMNAMLAALGKNINFKDRVWLCDNSKQVSSRKSTQKIYFTNIPEQYVSFVKYYVIISSNKLSSIKADIGNIGEFLRYLNTHEKAMPLLEVNSATVERYRRYVDTTDTAKSTKVKRLQAVANLFWKLSGWEGIPVNNPVNKRTHLYKRKKSDNEIKTRYIPDKITKELDKIFYTKEVPIHFRLYYWFCRLYPSRASEISLLKTDCIKQLGNMYVFFKEEEKSSNDIGESNLMDIYIKYEDMGKYLVDLYHEQKRVSQELQDKADEKLKGLLFLYNPITKRHKEPRKQNRVCLVVGTIFNNFLKKLCKEKNIDVNLDEGIKLTSHSFRHNAITDRNYEGFSTTAIRDLGGPNSDEVIFNSYHYRKKEEVEKLQKKSLKERFSKNKIGSYEEYGNGKTNEVSKENILLVSSKVMFKGRITNLDADREKRILSNKRAYQISYSDKCIGICTEIASCSNGIFNCFKCSDFAPDSNELAFFKEQVSFWQERIDYFQLRGSRYQMEHAIEVKALFKTVVMKVEEINKLNDLGVS